MIALIDYDAGNIKSVEKAFQSLGKEVVLTRDPDVLKRADHVVLPGVGSFGDAMENLNRYHQMCIRDRFCCSRLQRWRAGPTRGSRRLSGW